MSYKINFEKYSNNVVLPFEIVSCDLEQIDADFLKVALVIYSNTTKMFEIEEISDTLNISHKKVRQALEYWNKRELLQYEKTVVQKSNVNVDVNVVTQPIKPPKAVKIQNNVIVDQNKKTNDEVVFLLDAIQKMFKHETNTEYYNVIVYVVEQLKLPSDVILLAFHYCNDIMEKFQLSYFKNICISWAEKEINTSEKADRYLVELKSSSPEENSIKELFKIERLLLPKEKEFVRIWSKDYGYNIDMIACAGELTLSNTGKYAFPYMNKILSDWHSKCFFDVEQVRDLLPSNKRNFNMSTADTTTLPNTSYDIRKADSMWNEVPRLV